VSGSARCEAARLLVVGFAGTTLAADERRILCELVPGGVILFARNVGAEDELCALVAELRRLLPDALLYVDLEGGRVDRLRGLTGGAPAASALVGRPTTDAERVGRWIGRALRAFDLDVDLAPVVDLDRGERDNALDGRYLGSEPRAVAARGRAFLRGLHAAGAGGCLKHFPGLGAARMDTHRGGAPIELRRDELERDLAPFRLLGTAAGAIMISHASYSALDPSGRPATLSPAIATGVLRDELGFRGLAISDDLEMGALARWGSLTERTAAALAAGCDLLPICASLAATPAIADRLARADLRRRRGEAGARLETYRRGLRRLRRGRRGYGLEAVRAGLAGLREAFES